MGRRTWIHHSARHVAHLYTIYEGGAVIVLQRQTVIAFFCVSNRLTFFYLAGYYLDFLKMNAWDTKKRAWIEQRFHALQSVISFQREFRRDFGGTLLSRWTIMRLINITIDIRMFVFKKQSRLLHRQFRQIQEFQHTTYRCNLKLTDGHYNG